MRDRCEVLDWAASGAMALTGMPEGPPVASPAPALSMLARVTAEFARVTRETGNEVRADPAELVAGRAALAGFTRGGRVSAGGSSFLLRAVDGWCAVTLSRPDDLAAVPAIVGALGIDAGRPDPIVTLAQARSALTTAALGTSAEEFAAAGQLVGVPAAALPAGTRPPGARSLSARSLSARPPGARSSSAGSSGAGEAVPVGAGLAGAVGWPPWRTTRIAERLANTGLAGAVVADLSSMWAGPLCARLLGLAGAEVIKVESPARPDGARSGDREFFDWLHAGHRSLAVDFGTRNGRAVLASLLEVADVVIESSRPRALAALGVAPGMIRHPPGQVWLSITGYGRSVPERVAFGDDAAVAGGLVGWPDGEWTAGERAGGDRAGPVFCADAIADPLTGACGALAVALSRSAGGGELIDLPMRDVAAAFAAAAPDHGPHHVGPDESVTCPSSQHVLPGGALSRPSSQHLLPGGAVSRPSSQHLLPGGAVSRPDLQHVLPGGLVSCPLLHREQAVLPPRRPAAPAGAAAHAAELGADTSVVLAWLASRPAAC